MDRNQEWLITEKKQLLAFLESVRKVKSLVKKLGTFEDSQKIRNDLKQKREQTKELEKDISKKLEAKQSEPNNVQIIMNDPEYQMLLQKFIKYREYWKTKLYKNSFLKEKALLPSSCVDNEPSNNNETYTIEQKLQKVDIGPKYISKEELAHEIVQDRNKKIQELKGETETVAHLYKTTATMLATQQAQLDLVENNILHTEAQTEEAIQTLAKVGKDQANSSMLTSTAIGVALGGTVGLLLGPVGMVVGASTGAAVGSMVGNNIGHLQTVMIDKELFEHHTKSKWVPDETVTTCHSCKALFTQVLRKHHCRSCGQIFCYICSSKKITFKFDNMDTERQERVCDTCHKSYWNQ